MVLMKSRKLLAGAVAAAVSIAVGFALAQQPPRGKTSYMPVAITEPFSTAFARLSAEKPEYARDVYRAAVRARYVGQVVAKTAGEAIEAAAVEFKTDAWKLIPVRRYDIA